MKKIINGRMYNTETATPIVENNQINGSFFGYEETLYRKKTGEFFLYGKGGPASKYAHPGISGGWDAGEKIVLIPEEETKKWLERFEFMDEYIELFGEPEE